MAISINKSEDSREGSKLVYFTIGYGGKDYKWHGNMPSDADAQEYWDSESDRLIVKILRKQYSDAVVPQLENSTSLKDFEAWVSTGATNAEVKGEDFEGNEVVIKAAEVIEKKTWVDTH